MEEIKDAVGNILTKGDIVITHALFDSDTGIARHYHQTNFKGLGMIFCRISHLTAEGNIVVKRIFSYDVLTYRKPESLLKYEGIIPDGGR